MLGRLRPSLWVIAAACLFGASTPMSKMLLGTMGPLRLAGLLYLGAAITVLPWALRGPRAQNRWRARNVARLAGVVLFGGVLGPIALLFGLTRAPASSVALWLSLETVFTAIFAALMFREHVGARGWIAVVVITAASVAIASPSGFEAGSRRCSSRRRARAGGSTTTSPRSSTGSLRRSRRSRRGSRRGRRTSR